MNILVDIGHPAHVHFFKNIIWEMQKRGHKVLITARLKESNLALLRSYGLDYHQLGKKRSSAGQDVLDYPYRVSRLLRLASAFQPDVLCGIGNPYVALVGRLLGKPSVIFSDSEIAPIVNPITFFLADAICTPSCFRKELGKKQVRLNGFKELAYLHPNYFKPDPSVLRGLELNKGDRLLVLRFVGWDAAHDVGQHGFSLKEKRRLVSLLEGYGRVFISSEKPLPPEFDKYRLKLGSEQIHHLLYYADLLVCEGATMATEAAILGTPVIRYSSFVGQHDMGNFMEIENKYGLMFNLSGPEEVFVKAVELLNRPALKQDWSKKKERLLSEKIDVTRFMTEFILDSPHSLQKYQEEHSQ